MTGLVVPPSAITVAIGSLRPHLPAAVEIAGVAPVDLVDRFIRIQRVGGSKDWAIDRPMLLVECFARTAATNLPDAVAAEQLALTAYAALESAPLDASSPACYWSGGALTEFPNPDYPQHSRWQFTGTLGIGIS